MSTQVQFKDYSMGFKDDDGKVYNLIDHLNMQLDEGKALGIVGESGCGKSTLGRLRQKHDQPFSDAASAGCGLCPGRRDPAQWRGSAEKV